MYIIAILIINFFHFSKFYYLTLTVLVIIFLIQLIFPDVIPKIIRYIIFIVEFIFLCQFVWEFLKFRVTISEFLRKIILFLDQTKLTSDKDEGLVVPEYYLLALIYMFYIQYQIYNTESYSESIKKDFDLELFIKIKLTNYPNISRIIFNTFMILKIFYVWLIIFLFFFFITYFEVAVLFSVKLLFMSIVLYQILKISTNQGVIKYIWFLIIYSMINTMLVYFYQFTTFDLIKEWWKINVIDNLPDYILDKFELFGFKIFKTSQLPLSFLSHYGSNLMSVLLLHESKRLITNLKLRKVEKIEEKLHKDNNLNESISKIYKQSGALASVSKDYKIRLKNYKKEFSLFQLYFLYVANFLFKIYWILLFLLLCASLIMYYQLSVYMWIYLLTSLISFMILIPKFYRIAYPTLQKDSLGNYRSNNLFFSKSLIL